MTKEQTYTRLSDLIFEAVQLALKQKDVTISETLINALEMSMTRGAGGKEFVEKRKFPEEFERIYEQLRDLKSQ